MTISDRIVDLADEGYDIAVQNRSRASAGSGGAAARPIRRWCVPPRNTSAATAFLSNLKSSEGHNCLHYTHIGTSDAWHFSGPKAASWSPSQGQLHPNDDEALSQTVLSGLGVAMLPPSSWVLICRRAGCRRSSQEYIPVERFACAVYLPTRHLPAKVRVFIIPGRASGPSPTGTRSMTRSLRGSRGAQTGISGSGPWWFASRMSLVTYTPVCNYPFRPRRHAAEHGFISGVSFSQQSRPG